MERFRRKADPGRQKVTVRYRKRLKRNLWEIIADTGFGEPSQEQETTGNNAIHLQNGEWPELSPHGRIYDVPDSGQERDQAGQISSFAR